MKSLGTLLYPSFFMYLLYDSNFFGNIDRPKEGAVPLICTWFKTTTETTQSTLLVLFCSYFYWLMHAVLSKFLLCLIFCSISFLETTWSVFILTDMDCCLKVAGLSLTYLRLLCLKIITLKWPFFVGQKRLTTRNFRKKWLKLYLLWL